MNTINRRKTLSVYPDIKELEYSSKLDTSTLNGQLRSIEESALRALLRSREITSELDRIELGLIKSYQAISSKYGALEFENVDQAYASAYSVANDKTSAADLLYDTSYGLVTLNPIGSYSKIPRGEKYDGKVSPQVTMYLDGNVIEQDSEAYDALDGTNKYFWIEEVAPKSTHEIRIDLPPSLTKRFNYIELFPFPLYGMIVNKLEYEDFRGVRWDITKDIYGSFNPLATENTNTGESIKLYTSPKEFNGSIFVTVTATSIGAVGFSNIDVKMNDFDNTTKSGFIRFDSFGVMSKPASLTLSSVSLDYYFDGPTAQSLVTNNESPITVTLRAGKEIDGILSPTNDWQHRIDLTNSDTLALNDLTTSESSRSNSSEKGISFSTSPC